MRHSMVQTATRSEVAEASLRSSVVKGIDPVIANNPTFDSTEIPVDDHVVRNARVVVNYEKPTSSVVRKSNRVIGENGYTCLTKNKKIQKECWKMRALHEEKLRELESEWMINGADNGSVSRTESNVSSQVGDRQPNEVPNPSVFARDLSSSLEVTANNNRLKNNSRLYKQNSFAYNAYNAHGPDLVSTKTSVNTKSIARAVSDEAFCMPMPVKKSPLKRIGTFTCLSRSSRKLKKEIKRMKKLINEELSSGTGMISNGDPNRIMEMDYLQGKSSRNLVVVQD